MTDFAQCPVCGALVLTEDLDAHIQEELDEQTAEGAAATAYLPPMPVACERCGASVPLAELDSHLLAHELEADPGSGYKASSSAAGPGPSSSADERCARCGLAVPLSEMSSHLLAHKLQAGGEDETTVEAIAAAATEQDAAELERRAFEELRQRYGFTETPQRQGACHLCGQEGHW